MVDSVSLPPWFIWGDFQGNRYTLSLPQSPSPSRAPPEPGQLPMHFDTSPRVSLPMKPASGWSAFLVQACGREGLLLAGQSPEMHPSIENLMLLHSFFSTSSSPQAPLHKLLSPSCTAASHCGRQSQPTLETGPVDRNSNGRTSWRHSSPHEPAPGKASQPSQRAVAAFSADDRTTDQ